MVGRDRELAALTRCLGALGSDPQSRPLLVLLQGEAGVGKTRLLQEFCRSVGDGLVLAGSATGSGVERPFALIREALAVVVAGWSAVPEPLLEREHALRHVLAPLISDHGPVADHDHPVDELVQAAVELFSFVATRPVVVALEDLHWADEESLAVITRLAATPGLPVLLVGSLRPEDLDRRHALAPALGTWERQSTVLHVVLGRLAEADLGAMLEAAFGRPVPHATVRLLHDRTQGNPFFVEELVTTAGGADPDRLATTPLPWNATEAVLRRVDELDPATRTVLRVAAELGAQAEFDLLAAASGLPGDDLLARLRVLVGANFLHESDDDVFAFRHALTREAVADQLLGREQQRIHAAVLDVLRQQGDADPARLAHHAARAGASGDAVRYARVAADRSLSAGSGTQALQLATLGLEHAGSAPAEDELALRATAARAARQIGEYDLAQEHAGRWRLLAIEAGDASAEAGALRLEAEMCSERGDSAGHWDRIRRAVAVAEAAGPSPELAWCYAELSRAHMLADQDAETIHFADRALDLAGCTDAAGAAAYALVNKAMVVGVDVERSDEALAMMSAAYASALDRHDVVTATRAIFNTIQLLRGRPRSVEHLRGALADGDALQARYGRTPIDTELATFHAELAMHDGDGEALDRALDNFPAAPDGRQPAVGLLWRAWGEAEAGRPSAAVDALTAGLVALGLVEGTHRHWSLGFALVAHGHAGDGAATAQELAASLDEWNSWSPTCRRLVPSHIGRCVLAVVGRVPMRELQPIIDGVLAFAGPRDGYVPAGLAALLAAFRAEGAGNLDSAMMHARASIAEGTDLGALQQAQSHVLLARCLGAGGDRREAATAAERAVALLDGWPGWRRDDATDLLHRLSGGGAGAGGLTAREVEVLRQVARGLSNREIAERLYIAPKTAAVHVSNILGKTGAASRTEAASWAIRNGLLEPAVT
jgi:DNA-binding CsgD family transcriptional regulator/tetratricopeptide (TPR) repeat protein